MNNTIYSNDHKYLVKQLKNTRKEIGLDQGEVADLLDKTQSYISKIESGQRRIDVIEVKKWAKIYKKDINYFLK